MRKTPASKEAEIVSSIIEGISYASISDKTKVPISTIKKIKRRNLDTILLMEESEFHRFDRMKALANQLLVQRLDRSEKDQAVLEELNELYAANQISQREYARRKRYLKILTVSQLAAILKYADKHVNILSK